MMNKFIYVDVDECAQKWFPVFLRKSIDLGYEVINPAAYYIDHHLNIPIEEVDNMVREFNSSGILRNLEPIDDSYIFLKKICDEFGYNIVFITACGDYSKGSKVWQDRFDSLADMFGEENIHDLHCVEKSEYKKYYLKKYDDKGALFVDDNVNNVTIASSYGYEAYLYDSQFNQEYNGPLTRVKSWDEIYRVIKQKEVR